MPTTYSTANPGLRTAQRALGAPATVGRVDDRALGAAVGCTAGRAAGIAVLALVALAIPSVAWAQARATTSALELPAVKTWELDNGMKVAFLPLEEAPLAAVEVWYHVGSKDEPRERQGLAHMFEHMMFEGSARVRAGDHARFINSLGGYVNAVTTEDATRFVNVLPPVWLDFAIQLEAERMRSLLFRDSMIRAQRERIKRELRDHEGNFMVQGMRSLLKAVYRTHPYGWDASGDRDDLDKITPAELKAFYDSYYVPNNAMLVVVGAFDEAAVRAAADKWFAAIERAPAPPRPADDAKEPAPTDRHTQTRPAGPLGVSSLAYHIPAATHPDIAALEVTSIILGAGNASRLSKRLVQPDSLAVEVSAPLLVREHPGVFVLMALYFEPDAREAIERGLQAGAVELASAGPSADELERAKNQLQAQLAFGMQDAAGLAQQIGTSWILTGDPSHFVGALERYRAVTAADVQRVVSTYLTVPNPALLVSPPLESAAR